MLAFTLLLWAFTMVSGLDLPLLFSKNEALTALDVPNVGTTRKFLRDELNPYIVAT
jgi:hypothetical protein